MLWPLARLVQYILLGCGRLAWIVVSPLGQGVGAPLQNDISTREIHALDQSWPRRSVFVLSCEGYLGGAWSPPPANRAQLEEGLLRVLLPLSFPPQHLKEACGLPGTRCRASHISQLSRQTWADININAQPSSASRPPIV